MKGVAKIALSVALIVIVVLSIVVASVAWFTSNPEVTADDVTLNAARTLTVSFDSVENSNYKYNGQIGNVASGDDAPYVYQAGNFKVRVDTLSGEGRAAQIKIGFGTVTVSHPTGTVSDVLISDLFYITADVYQENENGAYVKIVLPKANESDPTRSYFRAYEGSEDNGLTRFNKAVADLSIRDDGVLMNGASPANFSMGVYELSFTYTFLPEAAYPVWSAGNYASVYGYERAAGGAYIGVVDYTAYKAKYHFGLTRYSKSGNVYTADENGTYVRVVTGYQAYADVTKYNGEHEVAQDGAYIKVGDSNDYVLYNRYNRINGFPYSDDKYIGETFTFTVSCTVEEV